MASKKKIKGDFKTVSVRESENLQKSGWIVVEMTRNDKGERVHVLAEKATLAAQNVVDEDDQEQEQNAGGNE